MTKHSLGSLLGAFLLILPVAVQADVGPIKPSLTQAAKINAELGIAYLQRGDIALAQQKIERALGQNSDDADVQTAAGLLYERIGEMDKADRHYQAAVRNAPQDPNRQANYGGFLCRRGTYDKGQKLLEEASKDQRYATPEVALTNAGVCARSANKNDQAERDFKAALNVRPTYPDALLQLIDLNFQRGDLINARGYLTRFMTSVPPNPDVLLLGVKIERAAGEPRAADEYASKLRRDFPDSEQARQLEDGTTK